MKLPEAQNTTKQAILKHYESKTQEARPHLGCSEIGNPCSRALWYSFRWASKVSFQPRMLRLFSTGVLEETRILGELQAIGAQVFDKDPETGRQYVFGSGHFKGSCDAVARGLPEAPKSWAIVEMKTHNAKSFSDLAKKGLLESKPRHYVQMQMYMGFSEGIERGLYFAVNKDDDDIYTEWVKFDKDCFDFHKEKAAKIIASKEPLEKLSQDPAWWECKFCDHYQICHQGKVAQKSCRTCVYGNPKFNGEEVWGCGKFNRPLSVAEQRMGCRSHLFLPDLIPFAEAIDTDTENFVLYQGKGSKWVNAVHGYERDDEKLPTDVLAIYVSDELQGMTKDVIENAIVQEAKGLFNGMLKGETNV